MIKIFDATDRYFESNGNVVLHPLKAAVHKEDNGKFYLDLECRFSDADYFAEGVIVSANTPTGYQAFRMTNIKKTKMKVSCRCWHLYYDAENYLIRDVSIVNKTAKQALTALNNGTDQASPFSVDSNKDGVASYRCIRRSLAEGIEAVLQRWGGHLVRDNFSIQIAETIGKDRGVTIQYRKNMRSITAEENWDKVVTKLMPVGKDGTLLNAVDPTASVYLNASTTYDLPYTKAVSFVQNINSEDYPDEVAYKAALVADLLTKGTAYLQENCVPRVNYTLKASLDNITDVGDVIQVIDRSLGIDLLTNVISYDYDCILKQITNLEFGNFRPTLGGLVENITDETAKRVLTILQGGE